MNAYTRWSKKKLVECFKFVDFIAAKKRVRKVQIECQCVHEKDDRTEILKFFIEMQYAESF